MKFMVSLITDGTLMDHVTEAKTLRYGEQGRLVVTDGPFTETKEQMAGYMVLECADLDEAIDWAGKLPVLGGAIEVRPITDYSP